ncbi:MAG: hypothetical protein ACT4P0_03950 [Panacagrimonas sp.]
MPTPFQTLTDRIRTGQTAFHTLQFQATAAAATDARLQNIETAMDIISRKSPPALTKVEESLDLIKQAITRIADKPQPSLDGVQTQLQLQRIESAIRDGNEPPAGPLSASARLILNFTTQLRVIVLDKHRQRADQKLGQLEHIQKQLAERFAVGSEAARQCRGILAPAPDLLKSFEGFSVLPSLERIDAYVQTLHRFDSEVMRRVQDPPPAPTDGTAATKSK